MRGWYRAVGMVGVAALVMVGRPVDSKQNVQEKRGVVADSPEVLKGVRIGKVFVGSIDPEAIKDGLSEQDIQTDVELKLQEAGILKNGGATLYLKVLLMKLNSPRVYVYSIRLALTETVVPVPDRKILVYGAETWSIGGIGTIGVARVRDVRNSIKDIVDKFASVYLAANPK